MSTLARTLLMTACLVPLAAQEKTVVSLHDLVGQEVRQQGFTLAKPQKVHIRATGAVQEDWLENGRTLAYGWILNAATREVVWQMSRENSKRQGRFQVADAWVDLPAGSYEAYMENASMREAGFLIRPVRNVDRRSLRGEGLKGLTLQRWKEDAQRYGMDLGVTDASAVTTFQGPLHWRNTVITLLATGDRGRWSQAFTVKQTLKVHVYAQGEGSGDELADTAWILDAHTRQPVWTMDAGKAQYGGGAQKNRRQVETITLPPGEYIAVCVTDGSHSPADWNATPPCDPLLYGLILSVTQDQDARHLVPHPEEPLGTVLAEAVKVVNHEHRTAAFNLAAPGKVRVYALGEADDDEMADGGWIEDTTGHRVWEMKAERTRHAGGADKNRVADDVLSLPKGTYTLHVRTDGSHAYGRWNDDAPWDADRYGITVYAAK